VVLSKCANPACTARFRYLREGRIFNVPTPGESADNPFSTRVLHYWLCDRCKQTLKVVLVDGEIRVCPAHRELPAPAKAREAAQAKPGAAA
jgi:hypothetical protein